MTTPAPRWLLRLLLVLIPPLLLFGLAEALCWTFDVPRLADNENFQKLEFMRECRSGSDLIETRCAPEGVGEATKRRSIFVFGGSSVQGHPIGETTPFASHMQVMLDQRHPGEYAVRNLGVACRDSIYVRKCAETIGGEAQDLYVIYAGHNDFANFMVANPRLRIFSEEHPALFDFPAILAKSRFYSLLASWIRPPPRAKVASWVRLPDPEWGEAKQIALDEYTRNITRVIEQAAELGIRVVLVTVVSNVSEYPAEQARWHKMLDRERPFPEWLDPWKEQFRIGVEEFEAGRPGESIAAFERARDLSMGGRAPSELNERLRELSRAYDHVDLVDFELRLHRIGVEEGLLGCNFFGTQTWCDQFHPNPRTQHLIAQEIVKHLVASIRGQQPP